MNAPLHPKARDASKIKVMTLADMARRYRSGALHPRIGGIASAAQSSPKGRPTRLHHPQGDRP